MKVIGNLIVIDVPKNYKEFRIKMGELQFNHNGITGRITGLESGDYEIIGLASEIDDAGKLDSFKAAQFAHYADTLDANWDLMLKANELQRADTTDLLFLKRI